jgi:hypothetical protein
VYFKTHKQFNAFVPLGKQTYCALDDQGNVYTVWLSLDNKIQYAWQKFSAHPHIFIKIAGDKMLRSSTGFRPKVAFLTDKGELYCTHLGMSGIPALWYIATIPNVDAVRRLYYDQGRIFVINKGANDSNIDALIYNDNEEMMFLCYLLKRDAKGFFK